MNRLAELNQGEVPVSLEEPADLEIPDYVLELRETETRITKDIKALRNFADTIHRLPPSEDARGELESILQEYRPVATRVKKELDTLRNENERAALAATAQGGAEEKMRNNVYLKLLRSFSEALKDLNESQTDHKHKYIEKVTRTAKIASPDIDEKTIEDLVDRGDADALFMEKVIGPRKQEAAEALIFVQGQYRDLQRLQASILELHQMFLDMETMISMQGETLNHIEENVNSSVAYAGEATRATEKAEAANISMKHRRACCAGGLAGVMAITAGGLAASMAACTVM